VREIWRAFGLRPWREDSFTVSPDPDLIGLYMSSPVAAAVFAIDEKPHIQALNRTAPTLSTDVAPSPELRKWYGHVAERFQEFSRRYRDELTREPAREVSGRASNPDHDTAATALQRSGAAMPSDVLEGR
jgi:hypothetical protein